MTERRVAIKTIKVENLPEAAVAEYEARLRTEARSPARLQHPNIVRVCDSERHGDSACLMMEFVQGEDLKQHLDGGRRYSLKQSVAIMRDLLAALEYAHKSNDVHRDVKPANLLMVESSGHVIMHQILEQNPPAPGSINTAFPKAIDAVVARGLAKDRDKRYGSAAAFSTAMRDSIAQVEDTTMVKPPAGIGERGPDGFGSYASTVRTCTGGSTRGDGCNGQTRAIASFIQ